MDSHNSSAERGENTKKRVSTLYIVMCALLTAMTFAATMLIQIPVGIGYINFGDAVVMTSGVVLGPVGAMAVGALGSSLADIATGYMVDAPFTFIVKGLEGFICGLLFKKILVGKSPYLRALTAFLPSAAIVTVGYFFADFLLTLFGFMGEGGDGAGTLALINGAATLVPSLIQVGISFAVAMAVAPKLPTLEFMSGGKNR